MASPVTHRLRILGAAALFSTGGAAIKLVTLTNWQVACIRSGIAAVVLLIALPGERRFWRPRVLLVGIAYAVTLVLYVSGNKLTTAANTIFLQSTAPIYLLILGPWFLHERIRRHDLAFTAALGIGMLLFFMGVDPPVATAPRPLLGNLLGVLCGFTWALTILGLRWLSHSPNESGTASVGASVIAGNLIACAACLPFALPIQGATALDWTILGYLGVFQIGLAYVWMTRAVRHVPVLETGLLLLLEPVLNAITAWAVHGERPGPWSLVGCTIILIATLWHTVRAARLATRSAG